MTHTKTKIKFAWKETYISKTDEFIRFRLYKQTF